MSKRKYLDMSNTIPHRKKKKERTPLSVNPPIQLTDLNSLIAIAQHSTNANVTYPNINNKTLQNILPQLIELKEIIGMEELKQTVFYQIIYYLQELHKKSDDYLHTVILGMPGCGKTTVAKIIGTLYSNLGILKNKTFTIAKRADLIGEYLGQTSIKTSKLLKSCIGGVLFIDEVYSLGSGSKDKKDSYSKEAIDALNIFLSEHKKDFCCIIAGYEQEVMDCFFSVNQGLERRFPWIHKISKYSPSDLAEICSKKIKDIDWQTTVTKTEMVDILEKHKDNFKNAGGDIENMITKAKMLHAKRVFPLDSCHKFILTNSDFTNAIEYIIKHHPKEKTESIPFEMYS
jgi:SpoVK/Ycf46/Vps4 family AAA+-type ATPase